MGVFAMEDLWMFVTKVQCGCVCYGGLVVVCQEGTVGVLDAKDPVDVCEEGRVGVFAVKNQWVSQFVKKIQWVCLLRRTNGCFSRRYIACVCFRGPAWVCLLWIRSSGFQ